jgi:hypothetical protein
MITERRRKNNDERREKKESEVCVERSCTRSQGKKKENIKEDQTKQ